MWLLILITGKKVMMMATSRRVSGVHCLPGESLGAKGVGVSTQLIVGRQPLWKWVVNVEP